MSDSLTKQHTGPLRFLLLLSSRWLATSHTLLQKQSRQLDTETKWALLGSLAAVFVDYVGIVYSTVPWLIEYTNQKSLDFLSIAYDFKSCQVPYGLWVLATLLPICLGKKFVAKFTIVKHEVVNSSHACRNIANYLFLVWHLSEKEQILLLSSWWCQLLNHFFFGQHLY